MKIKKNIRILFSIISLALFLVCVACRSSEQTAIAQSSNVVATLPLSKQTTEINSEFFKTIGNNPCLFFEENGYKQSGFEQFNELQNAGYPKMIALAEGVAFFNRLAQCNQVGKTQPDLRPEEVVGAIASWDCAKETEAFQTKPYDENTCRQFKEIIKTGNLPKGAWLDQSGGTCPNCNGYTVAVWEIRLYLNQDKYRRDYKGNPVISRLLRLNYPMAERNQ